MSTNGLALLLKFFFLLLILLLRVLASTSVVYVQVNVNKYVPSTCCVLNFNQDRELYWVDPQKPQPRDEKRCNEDAAGKIDNSANLNGRVSNDSLAYLFKSSMQLNITA